MNGIRRSAWGPAAIAVAALSLSVCGGGSKNAGPKGPTVPVEPTPTSTPPPAFQPLSASCAKLPLGATKYTCRDPGASYLGEVSDAIETLKSQHPEYFSGDRVTNVGAYYVGVIKNLDQQGICAGFDGEELQVKTSADFNDQYKIMTSWGQIRKFYIGTCYPAVFPLSFDSPPSTPGCGLAPSREIACGDPPAQFDGDVEAAIDQLIKQKPELFDFTQHAPGNPNWPLVKDLDGYQNGIVNILNQKGYCGRFDGEEVQLKRTNDFNEQYDVNYADKYVRRGSGTYRGACYPAAF